LARPDQAPRRAEIQSPEETVRKLTTEIGSIESALPLVEIYDKVAF